MYEGMCYVIKEDMNFFVKPFEFVRDVDRILFSEDHESYLAIRLSSIKNHNRDHIIFETVDRELFADFVMDYADRKELDEVMFEQNEEFSIIVKNSPQWFSFQDLDNWKKQEHLQRFADLEVKGFLQLRQKISHVEFIKSLFTGGKWLNRYCCLQNFKLYIYENRNYSKPERVIELSKDGLTDFRFKEVAD